MGKRRSTGHPSFGKHHGGPVWREQKQFGKGAKKGGSKWQGQLWRR